MFSGHVRDLLQRVPDRVAQKRGKYFRAFNFPARKGTWRDRSIYPTIRMLLDAGKIRTPPK